MPKIIEVPGIGKVEFPDSMSDQQIISAIETDIIPSAGVAKPFEGRGGVLPSFAEGFATGFTDIPLGIAGLFTARPEETAAGKFSTGARGVIQDVLGIDPTKEATTAETGASALGSLGSFFVPGLGAAGLARGVGMGARAASAIGTAASVAQGSALGVGEAAQRAVAREQATGQRISDADRRTAQLLGGAIGLTELLPLQRFLGPLEKILAKVPLSKAGAASELIEIGVKGAIKSGTAEGAQEAISQLAQNLVEKGIYNPELDATEGLLGNAAAGGFAGGTVDAILQMMAGRKIRKQTTARTELGGQLKGESDAAADERARGQALDGVAALRAAGPTGTISVVESTMPDKASKFYIVDANKKPITSFDSIDAAISAGKQYETDSGGVTKFEPPTITEMVKIKTPKVPKLTKAEKNKARQEAKRLKAQGALAPAPTIAPATTPEGQATTEASIEKVVAETPVIAPKKGRKPLAPTEAVVPPEAAPPVVTAAEITLPETPTEAPPAAELTADERVAIWKGIAPEAQSFRDLNPDQQATYFEALKAAKPVGVKPYTGAQPKLSAAPVAAPEAAPAVAPEAAAAPAVPEASDVPKGYKKVEKPRETALKVAFRPLESTPEGAAKAAEMDAKKDRVATALNKVLAPIVAKDVRLNLVSHIATKPDEKGNVGYARGEVTSEGKVINLSLDIYDPALTEDQLIDKLMGEMNHEIIHTLTDTGLLNSAEIKTLFDAADKTKYQGKSFTYFDRAYETYKNVEGYSTVRYDRVETQDERGNTVSNLSSEGIRVPDMDMITEEAVAEMFRDYRAGKLKLNEKPKGIFNKIIQFFKRMFRGFRDAEIGKVFTRIESGEVGARQGVAAPAGGAKKLSVAPQEKGAAFRRLASAQRGLPESAMLDAQMALGKYPSGPALGRALESVGDLSHRMAENPENNRDRGLEVVSVKVGAGLRLASNATDIERIGAIPDLPELTAYADEHAKLPAYNDAQRAARDAAVALGRRNFSEAERNLLSLKSMIDNGTYVDIAGSFDPQYEGAVAPAGAAVTKLSISAQPNSGSTQIATTTGSYRNAAKFIKNTIPNAQSILDYGAGLGLGSDAMRQESGIQVDSYEPVPSRWQGKEALTFSESDKIDRKYDAVVNLNVLNVLEPELRETVVRDIISKIAPGGVAVIGTRKFKGDVDTAKNGKPTGEKNALWIMKPEGPTYQRGFDGSELVDYLKKLAPEGYTVERGPKVGASSAIIRAPSTPSNVKFSVAPAVGSDEFAVFMGDSNRNNESMKNGVPVKFYHGTSKDVDFKSFKDSERGIWLETNEENAKKYSLQNDSMGFRREGWDMIPTNQKPRVIPLYARMENTLDLRGDGREEFAKANNIPFTENYARYEAAITRMAKYRGYDSIRWGDTVYSVFSPYQVKRQDNEFAPGATKSKKFSVAPAVGSDEFNRWFDGSVTVDEDGKPLVFYHGTGKNFKEFKNKDQSANYELGEGPFFFTPSKRFANDYAETDNSAHGGGKTIKSGGRVIPVFLSVKNPFDYTNSAHVEAVMGHIWDSTNPQYRTQSREDFVKKYSPSIATGSWRVIEDGDAQFAIRELGFDGFYQIENGTRNLAVYKPQQVKSIFNEFAPGAAESKKFSVAPSAYENVPFLEKPAAVQKQILGDVDRMRRKANDIAKDAARKSDTTLADSANAANIEVRNSVRKLSVIPQPHPQSSFFEAANSTLFSTVAKPTSPGERIMDLLGGLGSSAGRAKFMDAFRVNYVQAAGQIAKYMRQLQIDGKIESGMAQYDAIASIEAAERASHQIPSMIQFGAGEVRTINGDPNSMYFIIDDNNGDDTPAKFFRLVETGGPNGTSLSEQFKTLLVARAVVKRQGEGKDTPLEVTPQYIQNAEALAIQYPVLEEAYGRYQRFNRKLIKAAMDAGVISQDTFEAYTDDMNYYSMYREVGGEVLAPQPYGSTGKAVKIKAFKGSEQGALIADPMVAMIRNMSFWTGATMRNIAAQKAHRVAMEAKIGRNLIWQGSKLGWQSPDSARGEDERFMSYLVDGTEVRYAVTDSLFAVGLANTESSNLSLAMELMGLPTTALREMVTRDPGFMIANLLRDSISTWILAGSGANPVGTLVGLKKAFMNDVSYQNLKRMGVVGSYDEAQKSPKQMVAGLRANIMGAQGLTNATDALKWGWDRLGKLSDASDAATRIAVYEAAIKDGADEYTAAYRALSIMNFSRRGAAAGLSVATRLIPFLNARIQGFDVLYTGVKSAVQLTSGAEQTAFEKQRGAAVWYRGLGLMAGALALAMLNEDDEDYKQIPQYIRDANFLIPVGGSKFLSIPKPFEAGLIFGTVPTTMYEMMRGTRSTRSGIKLFTSQLSSTFGFNPMPQVALPIFENLMNADFYTGQPLISPGAQKLDPSLQYNASTSYVARGLGKLLAYSPFGYDYESGKFEGVSPIMIDNLITGYGGPIAGYVSMGIGGLIGAFGEDSEGIPVAGSNLPVIRRFFVDAQDKQPQAAAEAYELYQLVDKATRTASRLKKMGDVEALREFRAENVDLLRVGKQVRKMAENLNNIRAQVRRLEVNTTMSGSEKKEKMRELRARELQVSRRVEEINLKLGR